MALPAHLIHTQGSPCDKILPWPWNSSLLSVLAAQTRAQVSWVAHGLWRTRAGGGALVSWHPHPKVIFLLLCSTKTSSPWHFHREYFPFVPPKKLALCFLLDLGVYADLGGLRQNKTLKTIQNNAQVIYFYSCKTNEELGKLTFCQHLSPINPYSKI